MSGLNLLNSLPESVKQPIIAKYGTIQAFYDYVFELEREQHSTFKGDSKSPDNVAKRNGVQDKLFDVMDELEAFGLEDGEGHSVVTEIASDFGEALLRARGLM